uniref:Uncharacterized protein n=1 Tax=Siphoviridae sp. ct6bb17 TaxID=2825345 RepID=A0A8S5NY25_9CAUD|nr:MAG TPA: hypothetical protein [Siphoviridae sp. ct6bb17]
MYITCILRVKKVPFLDVTYNCKCPINRLFRGY